jgi:hypothetical protein
VLKHVLRHVLKQSQRISLRLRLRLRKIKTKIKTYRRCRAATNTRMEPKTARRILDRKPVQFKQLCAIAREIITAERTIDNFEWSERIKVRIVKLGYTYPDGDPATIHRAMRSVEVAMERSDQLRPFPEEPLPYRPPRRQPPPPTVKSGPSNPQAFAAVQEMIQRFLTSKR